MTNINNLVRSLIRHHKKKKDDSSEENTSVMTPPIIYDGHDKLVKYVSHVSCKPKYCNNSYSLFF